jgi:hypothetical protein
LRNSDSRLIATLLIGAMGAALLGCSAAGPNTLSSLVGRTFADVDDLLPEGATYFIQDASPIVGAAPSFTEEQFGQSIWTIVGVCADSDDITTADSIEIAVVPTDRSYDLDALDISNVITCEGREYRS